MPIFAPTSNPVYSMLPIQLGLRRQASDDIGTDGGKHAPSDSPWNPFVLTLWPSLILGLVLLGAVVGLEIFVQQSDLRMGFADPSIALQNLATYTPTAFVIVLGWVWQSYEVEVKKIVPWMAMSKGTISVSDSILLDYFSPNPLAAIIVATRKRHHSILVCALASLAIAVCSIVAAGIWDIEPTPRVVSSTLQRTGTFDSSSLENSADVAHFLSEYLARTVLQLPMPSWMTDNYVIAPFNVSQPEAGMVLTGTTQGYNANLTCEKANVSLSNNGTNITITYAGVSQILPCDVFVDYPWNWTYLPEPMPYLYTGKVYNWTTGSETPALLLATQLLPPNNCVSATAIGCIPKYMVSDMQVSVDSKTAVFNSILYSVGMASTVTYSGGGYFLQTVDNNNGVTGSPWDPSEEHVVDNDDPFSYIPWATSPPNVTQIGNYSPWFHLLRHLLLLDPTQLMDADNLVQGSQKIFSDIWRNVIQPVNTSDPFQGTVAVANKRLISRVGSIRVIQVCFCILAIIGFSVVFWRPSTRLTGDPSSLASAASILRESKALSGILQGTGALGVDELADRLGVAKYQLAIRADDRTVEIMVIPDANLEDSESIEVQTEFAERQFNWTPLILHPAAQFVLAAIVLALIAVLELLVQLSSHYNGLVGFTGQRVQRYTTSYVGPVILFLVGLGIEIFDSGVRAMHPFVILRRKTQPGNLLMYDPLYQSMITLPFHAFRHKQLMVLVSSLAVLLLHVAKIAVGGLFAINEVAHLTGSVPINLNTTFAWNGTALANEMINGITAPFLDRTVAQGEVSGDNSYELASLQLIVNAGLQVPNWTDPDVAIGSLATDSTFQSLPMASNLTARLPTLHSELVNCTNSPNSEQTTNFTGSGPWTVDLMSECLRDDDNTGSPFAYVVTPDNTGHAGAVVPMPGEDPDLLNCTTIFFIFVGNGNGTVISCQYTMTQ